jgi:RNA polymerase sigma factor (sigma-70 family)
MDERLHSMFRNEMSSQARPSLDGMPEEVLAKGRRARRARTAKIASATFAAVAAGIVAVAVVVPTIGPGHAAATHLGAVAKSAHPAHPAAKPAAKPHPRTAPTGGGTPASAAVMLTSASAAADAAELRLTLLDALGQLSPRDRAIIVLRYWEDHSVQTVSELLDLSPGVVKVQSMRALARLRVLLGEDEAPPPEPGARPAIPRPPVARSRP